MVQLILDLDLATKIKPNESEGSNFKVDKFQILVFSRQQ